MQVIERVGKTGALCICTICRSTYSVQSIYDAKKSKIGHICNACKTSISNITEITQANLQAVFNYNPDTGALTYKHLSKNGAAGEDATTIHNEGYRCVSIGKTQYLAHRIIYMYMTGLLPDQIDHVNHVRNDNTWVNLREVSKRTNSINTSLSKNSSTKVNGVAMHKPTNKYRAYINVDFKQIHLGLFNTIEEATAARAQADLHYGFHTNHGK